MLYSHSTEYEVVNPVNRWVTVIVVLMVTAIILGAVVLLTIARLPNN